MMKLPPSLQLRDYTIIATDPEKEWNCTVFTVRAIALSEARRAARVELAKERRDDWIIQCAPAEHAAA